MRGGLVWSQVKKAARGFPMLPALMTVLLLGCSMMASFGGKGGASPAGMRTVASRELRAMGFDEVARLSPPVQGPPITCNIEAARYIGKTLHPIPARNLQKSAMACKASCQKTEGCNAWKWCEDHLSCKDERGRIIPLHGCQLKHEALWPSGLPSNRTDILRKMAPRQYTAGYVQERNEKQATFLRMQTAPGVKMMITTYVPPAQCDSVAGSLVAHMSIRNKQDYAHWHKYLFNLITHTEDRTLRPPSSPEEGAWNKIGIIRKLLATYKPSEVGWILWMEPDAIFDNPIFSFPFEFYQGKDIITVADPIQMQQALSTGILLVRNSDWSREYFSKVASIAKDNMTLTEDNGNGGSDPVARAMMTVMKRQGLNESLSHFRLEGEFCLACDWRRIDLELSSKVQRTTVWGEENKRWKLFVTRFFDCDTCWPAASVPQAQLDKCTQKFQEHYQFAYCRFHRQSQAIQREAKQGSFLDNLEDQHIPSKGLNVTAFQHPQLSKDHIITSPMELETEDAHECYQACLNEKDCGFWIWCGHSSGCDNMGDFHGTFPHKGCQLSQADLESSPYNWDRGPQFSTFSSGYIAGNHPVRTGITAKFRGTVSRIQDRFAFASGVPTAPCMTPWGDMVIKLAVQNRQDYVRLHSQEYHLMAESIDPRLRMGAWQKLGLMRKLLGEIPRSRAEWIIWIDMDIIIQDMSFTFPLSKYDGKDFIIWGRLDAIKQGDVLNGVNSGVFMVRNTDWSRAFLDAWVPFGAFPANHTYDEMLRDTIQNYDIGMFEQNVIGYLVMKNPELLEKIHFESDYCFNCWYKDAFKPNVVQPPFIVHFAGCQVCTGFHPEKLGDCDRELVRVYLESHAMLRNITWARSQPSIATSRKLAA